MAWNVYTWTSASVALAQEETYTPANVEIGDVFTLTFTDDFGDTVAIAFTATAATVANVCTGLVAALKASAHPQIGRLTITDETTLIRIKAVEAGRPFNCASSTTNGGAANTQVLTKATVQSNVGPDGSLSGNWSAGHVPAAAEDVLIPEGAGDLLYGLDLDANAIGKFIRKGSGRIGRIEDGRIYDLRIDPDSCEIYGDGDLVCIDVRTAAIPITVKFTGERATGNAHAVYLRGSAITDVDVQAGDVGLAAWPNHTATVTSEFVVIGATLEVGEGVTAAGTTAYVQDGTIDAWASIPTVECRGGSYAQRKGNWTAAKVYRSPTAQGVLYADAGGTYATTESHDDSVVVASRTKAAKVFTNYTRTGTSKVYDPAKTVTYTNPITETASYDPDPWSGGGGMST